jgi:hypothetical protein
MKEVYMRKTFKPGNIILSIEKPKQPDHDVECHQDISRAEITIQMCEREFKAGNIHN